MQRLRQRIHRRKDPQTIFQLRGVSHLPQRKQSQHPRRHLVARSQVRVAGYPRGLLQVYLPHVRRTPRHPPLPNGCPPGHQGLVLHTQLSSRKVRHGQNGAGSVFVLSESLDRIQIAGYFARVVSIRQGGGGFGGFALEYFEGEAAGYQVGGEDEEGADEEDYFAFGDYGQKRYRKVQNRILPRIRLLPQRGSLPRLRIAKTPLQTTILRNIQGNGR
mmetsp:Transcript_29915/g.62946  ORF Transcript_29915/g.62946 Transcript_29915/m.62946 type:complete len:217 (+) Transcript_29915:609-1259(+)